MTVEAPEVLRNRIFSTVAKSALVLSIPAYFVALFVNRELGFLESLEIPIIAASILVVLNTVERIESRLQNPDWSQVRTYGSHTEFYLALRARVDKARRRVHTSYLRPYPPGELGESALSYFATCRAWADRSDEHRFRRVLLGSRDDGMADWLREELDAQENATHRNYQVRVLDWSLRGESEAVSVALIDDEYLFFAFSGEQDNLVGFSVRSRKLVKDYFAKYHDNLWRAARPLTSEVLSGDRAT